MGRWFRYTKEHDLFDWEVGGLAYTLHDYIETETSFLLEEQYEDSEGYTDYSFEKKRVRLPIGWLMQHGFIEEVSEEEIHNIRKEQNGEDKGR